MDDVLVVEVCHRAGQLQRGRDDGSRVWRAGRLARAVPPEVALQQEGAVVLNAAAEDIMCNILIKKTCGHSGCGSAIQTTLSEQLVLKQSLKRGNGACRCGATLVSLTRHVL